MNHNQKFSRIGAIWGIAGCSIFLIIAVLLEQLYWQPKFKTVESTADFLSMMGNVPYNKINMGSHLILAIAMLFFAISFIGLYHLFKFKKGEQISVTLGTVFGIIACAIMVEMAIIQATSMVKIGKMYLDVSNDIQRAGIVNLYRGLRYIDYALDVSFDIFFFSAWIMMGYSMLKMETSWKVLGLIGIALFLITAILNISSIPNPPSFELSPLCCIWLFAVYILAYISSKKINPE